MVQERVQSPSCEAFVQEYLDVFCQESSKHPKLLRLKVGGARRGSTCSRWVPTQTLHRGLLAALRQDLGPLKEARLWVLFRGADDAPSPSRSPTYVQSDPGPNLVLYLLKCGFCMTIASKMRSLTCRVRFIFWLVFRPYPAASRGSQKNGTSSSS